MRTTLTIGVVDDHWAISAGVLNELRSLLVVSGHSCSAQSVAELLAAGVWFDVVVLDVQLRNDSAAEDNVAALVKAGPQVVLYTQEQRPAVLGRCLQAGALALVSKADPPELLADAIRTAAAGEPFLTADWALVVEWMDNRKTPKLSPREREVLSLFASGLPLKSVARRAEISLETAKEHLSRVRAKYLQAGRPAGTKTELYFRAVEDGHIPLPTERGD